MESSQGITLESINDTPLQFDSDEIQTLQGLSYAELKLRCRLKGCSFKSSRIDCFKPKENPIVEKLESYFNIKIRANDPLSHSICDTCFEELQIFDMYVKICETAQKIMWATYLNEKKATKNQVVKIIVNEEFRSDSKASCSGSSETNTKAATKSDQSGSNTFISTNNLFNLSVTDSKSSHVNGRKSQKKRHESALEVSNDSAKNKSYNKNNSLSQSKRQRIDSTNDEIHYISMESVKENSKSSCDESEKNDQTSQKNGGYSNFETSTSDLSTFIDKQKTILNDSNRTFFETYDTSYEVDRVKNKSYSKSISLSQSKRQSIDSANDETHCISIESVKEISKSSCDKSEKNDQTSQKRGTFDLSTSIKDKQETPLKDCNKTSSDTSDNSNQDDRMKTLIAQVSLPCLQIPNVLDPNNVDSFSNNSTDFSNTYVKHIKDHPKYVPWSQDDAKPLFISEKFEALQKQRRKQSLKVMKSCTILVQDIFNPNLQRNHKSNIDTKHNELSTIYAAGLKSEAEYINSKNHETKTKNPEAREIHGSSSKDTKEHDVCISTSNTVNYKVCEAKLTKKWKCGPYSKTKASKNWNNESSQENNCNKLIFENSLSIKQTTFASACDVNDKKSENRKFSRYDPADLDLSELVFPKSRRGKVKWKKYNHSMKKTHHKKDKSNLNKKSKTPSSSDALKNYSLKNDSPKKCIDGKMYLEKVEKTSENFIYKKMSMKNVKTNYASLVKCTAGPLSSKTKLQKRVICNSTNSNETNSNETEDSTATKVEKNTDKITCTEQNMSVELSSSNDENIDDLDDAIDSFFTDKSNSEDAENSDEYLDSFGFNTPEPFATDLETNNSSRRNSMYEQNITSDKILADSESNCNTHISGDVTKSKQNLKHSVVNKSSTQNKNFEQHQKKCLMNKMLAGIENVTAKDKLTTTSACDPKEKIRTIEASSNTNSYSANGGSVKSISPTLENCGNKTIEKNDHEPSTSIRFLDCKPIVPSLLCPLITSNATNITSQDLVSRNKGTYITLNYNQSNSESPQKINDNLFHTTSSINNGVSNNRYSLEHLFSNPTEISPVTRKYWLSSPNRPSSINEFINDYSCKQCGNVFDKNIALQKHIARKHSNYDTFASHNVKSGKKFTQSKLLNNSPKNIRRQKKEKEKMIIKRAKDQMIQRNFEKQAQLLQQNNIINSANSLKDSPKSGKMQAPFVVRQNLNKQKENLGYQESKSFIKIMDPSGQNHSVNQAKVTSPQSAKNSNLQHVMSNKHPSSNTVINVDSIMDITMNDVTAFDNDFGQLERMSLNKRDTESTETNENDDHNNFELLQKNKESNIVNNYKNKESQKNNIILDELRMVDSNPVPNCISNDDSNKLEKKSILKSSEKNKYSTTASPLTKSSHTTIQNNAKIQSHVKETTHASDLVEKIRNIRIQKDLVTKLKENSPSNSSVNMNKPETRPDLRKLRFVKVNDNFVCTNEMDKTPKIVHAKSDVVEKENDILMILEKNKTKISDISGDTLNTLKNAQITEKRMEKEIAISISTEIEKVASTLTEKELDATSTMEVDRIQIAEETESTSNLTNSQETNTNENNNINNSKVDEIFVATKTIEHGKINITEEVTAQNAKQSEVESTIKNTNNQNEQNTQLNPVPIESTSTKLPVTDDLTADNTTVNIVLNQPLKENTAIFKKKKLKPPSMLQKLKSQKKMRKIAKKNVHQKCSANWSRQKDIIIDFKKAEFRPKKKISDERSKIKKQSKIKKIKSIVPSYSPNSCKNSSVDHEKENEDYSECCDESAHQIIATNIENTDYKIRNSNHSEICPIVSSKSLTPEKKLFNKDDMEKKNKIDVDDENDTDDNNDINFLNKSIDNELTQNVGNKANTDNVTVISSLGYDNDGDDIVDFNVSDKAIEKPEQVKKIFALTPEEINAKLLSSKPTSAVNYDNIPSVSSFHIEEPDNEYLLSEILRNTDDRNLDQSQEHFVSTVDRNTNPTLNNLNSLTSERIPNNSCPEQTPLGICEGNLNTVLEIPVPSPIVRYLLSSTTITKVPNAQSKNRLQLRTDLNDPVYCPPSPYRGQCEFYQKSPIAVSPETGQTSLHHSRHSIFSNQQADSTNVQVQRTSTFLNTAVSQTNKSASLFHTPSTSRKLLEPCQFQYPMQIVSPPSAFVTHKNSVLPEKHNYQNNLRRIRKGYGNHQQNSFSLQQSQAKNSHIEQATHQSNFYQNYDYGQQNQIFENNNTAYQDKSPCQSNIPPPRLNNGHFI